MRSLWVVAATKCALTTGDSPCINRMTYNRFSVNFDLLPPLSPSLLPSVNVTTVPCKHSARKVSKIKIVRRSVEKVIHELRQKSRDDVQLSLPQAFFCSQVSPATIYHPALFAISSYFALSVVLSRSSEFSTANSSADALPSLSNRAPTIGRGTGTEFFV